jgi:RHS repeat-associated protein
MKKRMLSLFCGIMLLLTGVAFSGERVYYYHNDPAGTPLAMTDASGTVVWRGDYKPFGEEYQITGFPENDKKFVGKEKDEETGLYYFGARYMEAKIGRFVSPDPVGAVDPKTGSINQAVIHDPQRLNHYAYGLNNPYKYVDPDGEFAIAIAIPVIMAYAPVIITGVEAAVITAVTYVAAKAAVEAYNASKSESKEDSNVGRLGGKEHRDKVKERAQQLKDEGHEITAGGGEKPERAVITPEGKRRFPDISTKDPNGNNYHENVGKQTQKGEPVSRERRALKDIDRATGKKTGFKPYD